MARPRKTGLDWVAVDTDAPSNGKFYRLGRMLGIRKAEAWGLYCALLCWMGAHHPDGNLTGVEDGEIDDAVGWCAPCGSGNVKSKVSFAAVLRHRALGIVTTSRRGVTMLHGWQNRNGQFWRELQRDRERKSGGRIPQENGRKTAGMSRSFPTVPDRTGHDMKKRTDSL